MNDVSSPLAFHNGSLHFEVPDSFYIVIALSTHLVMHHVTVA